MLLDHGRLQLSAQFLHIPGDEHGVDGGYSTRGVYTIG
jgi:hypothetical protein